MFICIKIGFVKRILFFSGISFAFVILYNCAKTGRPQGGPKDEQAPIFVTAKPAYRTINFDAKEIRLEFDEYVVLKDLNKQLIVSPPLKNPPLITPQGAASKTIKIKILDTLQANTTYIFNFGSAIEDNNENNKIEDFKYVFSTGTYIDSLETNGSISDAIKQKPEKSTSILLYKLDSVYTDSIIYKKKPNYVASTLDTSIYKFTNLRAGNYKVIALKENVSNYIFNPDADKIGFLTDTIQLPRDSIIAKPIVLFKEKPEFSFKRGKEITRGNIEFGFVGNRKNLKVEVLSKTPENFKSIAKFDEKRDTLQYWFTPFEADSLNFLVKKDNFLDTITVSLRKKNIDSLKISSSISGGTFHLRDTFFLKTNNPIMKFDSSKISIVNKDTLDVDFTIKIDDVKNRVAILFDKKPVDLYNIKMLPNALTDIFEVSNDTLKYRLVTKELEDYGKLTLKINNPKNHHLIIELLTGQKQEDLVERKLINSASENLIFDLLEPRKYTVRAIIDTNKNNEWDTGSYLKKLQPEKIIYHKELNNFEVRANYFVEQLFTIDD